jgi:hypothetical protein
LCNGQYLQTSTPALALCDAGVYHKQMHKRRTPSCSLLI